MPYTAVSRSIWSSRKFRQLDDFEKLFYLYLLTNEHVTSLGVYRLHWGHAMGDMDLPPEDAVARVMSAFEHLQELHLVEYDRDEHLVRMVNFLHFNPPQNPKHGSFLCGLAGNLPDGPIREHTVSELLSYENVRKCQAVAKLNGASTLETLSIQSGYGIETVPILARAHDTLRPLNPRPRDYILKKSKEKKGGPVDKSVPADKRRRETRAGEPKSAAEHLAQALGKLAPKAAPCTAAKVRGPS